jgi:hypothetical protein
MGEVPDPQCRGCVQCQYVHSHKKAHIYECFLGDIACNPRVYDRLSCCDTHSTRTPQLDSDWMSIEEYPEKPSQKEDDMKRGVTERK